MKTLLITVTILSSLSAFGNCNIEITPKLHSNFLYNGGATPLNTENRLIEALRDKGYAVRLIEETNIDKQGTLHLNKSFINIFANDFEGEPTLKLTGDYRSQQQGSSRTGHRIFSAGEVSIIDSATGEKLATKEKYSTKTEGIVSKLTLGLSYYPNHLWSAVKELPTCEELQLK